MLLLLSVMFVLIAPILCIAYIIVDKSFEERETKLELLLLVCLTTLTLVGSIIASIMYHKAGYRLYYFEDILDVVDIFILIGVAYSLFSGLKRNTRKVLLISLLYVYAISIICYICYYLVEEFFKDYSDLIDIVVLAGVLLYLYSDIIVKKKKD